MLNPVTEMKGTDFSGMIFEGVVVSNEDPLHEERCRIRIQGIHEDVADSAIPWARPVKQRTQGSTATVQEFSVPVVGSQLYVMLQGGDMMFPLYLGGVVNAATKCATADTNYPNRYGFKDAKGNIFFVDTTTGDVDFTHFSGTSFHISPTGALAVIASGDTSLDVTGNVVANISGNTTLTSGGNAVVDAATIELKGGSGTAKGLVQQDCMCAFTKLPHPQVSTTVKAAI